MSTTSASDLAWMVVAAPRAPSSRWSSRPTTIVSHIGVDELSFEFLDILCLNRYYGWYTQSGRIEEGLPLVEISQRALFFTPPLIQVENLVLEKKLAHDGNPVMTWMVSNLVVKISKFNELRSPTKERPENKIDGPMAMLMALGRALATQENTEKSFWE